MLDNPGFVAFVADDELRVRAAVAPGPDGSMTVLVRDDEEGDWRPLHEVGPDDALALQCARLRRRGHAAAHDQLGRGERGQARLARLRDR